MNDQEWIAKLRDALEIPDIRSTDEPDAVVADIGNRGDGPPHEGRRSQNDGNR